MTRKTYEVRERGRSTEIILTGDSLEELGQKINDIVGQQRLTADGGDRHGSP
jgi:hypothetical protein